MSSSIFSTDVETKISNSVFSALIFHRSENSLYYDESYQRKYCWTTVEQQSFLRSLFRREPIDSISVAINDGSENQFCEIIDGRQRITTAFLFFDNEIPYITDDGDEIFYSDLSSFDKMEFKKFPLPMVELQSRNGKPLSYESKVRFFYRKNFSGVPQSLEHKALIEKMIASFADASHPL